MRVYLDGQLVPTAGSTLTQALDAARAAVGARLLVEATADGAPIPEDHFDVPPPTDPYAAELRFTSADPIALARCTLAEAGEALLNVREKQKHAASMVQSGQVGDAFPHIGEVLAGWSVVRQAVEVIVQPSLGFEIGKGSAADLPRIVQDLAARLTELKAALSGQDWAGLGDSLAYDLDEQAGRWTTYLDELSKGLSPRG